ncbi:glutamate receptor 1-like [Vespa crabro]|uniref:glutamate receptor 1-like n=1 Tax=Vespa crabro TaxID=7445 RepID=UPI001F031655|nr:glutamate receptor 1-like [Vespa crabro]
MAMTASSSDSHSISDEQTPFLIDICKLYGPKSVVFLYAESIKEMEMTTMMFKWRRALSQEGIASTNLHFSQLHESSYYVKEIVRPYYIVVIPNYNAINEFSLTTSTFDMSLAVWLVIFIYKGHSSDYCYNPPGNIFNLRFNSVMLVRCGTENILREWYSVDANILEINDIATWSLEKGIIKLVPDFLYERRYNLQGLVMRAVALKETTFVNIKKNGELDGLFGKILNELSAALNFTFDIVSEMEEYGRWNPKEKTWSGAIAEVHAGRADIALAEFSINNDRLNAVDFTLPIFISKNYLFIRKPETFAVKWSSYFLTFTNSVWIATFGLLIAASILVAFLKLKHGNVRKTHLLSDNFLEIWGIFCHQGLTDFSGRSSLRIAYFSIFLLITVLWAAYSAALISFLTSPIRILPFHSLESFVQDGTYQLAVFHGSSYDMFANSQNPLAKKIMKLMLDEEKLPITALEGFERICNNPKLAIYTFDEMKKNIDNKLPCNVIQVGTGRINCLAIILSKHNPFTDIINFHLQKFVGNGMINRLKETIFIKKYDDMIKHQPVLLTDVISLIFFMLIGIVLSTCVLIIEKIIAAKNYVDLAFLLNTIIYY